MDIDLSKGCCRNLVRDNGGRWRLARNDSGYKPAGDFVSDVYDLGGERHQARLQWIAQWTAPFRWTKHPGNPIYGPRQSGSWDSWTNGVSILPLADGKTYRMYYAGTRGEGIGFAEASIDDPLTWKEHPASPVLKPRVDNWEGNLINQPRVVSVTANHWRMYYTGWGFKGPGMPWAMGLAESFDGGITWQRVGDQPILDRGDPLSPDGGGACVPMVVQVGERWMMWYTAVLVRTDGRKNIHLCLATSLDGLRWDKYAANPVLSDDFEDGTLTSVTSRCYVRHDDGVFRIWYSFGKPDYRILYAESLDGIHWERAPIVPVLGPSPAPAWDDKMVEYPEVQIVNGTFRLWFCGNAFGSVGYAEGVPETGVDVFVRSGETQDINASGTEWRRIQRDARLDVRRYVQVRMDMWSRVPALSPAFHRLSLRAENGQ